MVYDCILRHSAYTYAVQSHVRQIFEFRVVAKKTMALPADAIQRRIEKLTQETKLYVVFVGSFGGKFTKHLTDDVNDILSHATNITDIGVAYVRILYIESCSMVAYSTIRTIKRLLRSIVFLQAVVNTSSLAWEDLLAHLHGMWDILFAMDSELVAKFRNAYVKEFDGSRKEALGQRKAQDPSKPRYVETTLSSSNLVQHNLGEPARVKTFFSPTTQIIYSSDEPARICAPR